MENFPVIKDFYDAGAALEVNEEGLYSKLKELLSLLKRQKKSAQRLNNCTGKMQALLKEQWR